MKPLYVGMAAVAIVVIAAYGAWFIFPDSTPPPQKNISDFPVDFSFEIASTSEAREQGLSGRPDIPSGYGMLFVFDTPGNYGFWMKDMLVPIDVIWLSGDGTILGIERAVSPDSYPQTFYPPSPASFVLEMRVGESSVLGLEVGGTIPLPVP